MDSKTAQFFPPFFFFFPLSEWFREISWKETPLVKTKDSKEKVGTKWTYWRQVVIHGPHCALPLSLPQYTFQFYCWIRAGQTIALLLATKNHLGGKKGMLSAERGNRDIWGHTKTDICSFAFHSELSTCQKRVSK